MSTTTLTSGALAHDHVSVMVNSHGAWTVAVGCSQIGLQPVDAGRCKLKTCHAAFIGLSVTLLQHNSLAKNRRSGIPTAAP